MATFEELEPKTRCYALVGRFLQGWGTMEITLHNAIGAALSIENVKLWILCANIRFRDKTDILRTLIDVSHFKDGEKQRAKTRLRKLGKHATRRNMIAHDPFEPDESSKGVKFLTTKAKGEFGTPEVVWSPHRFDEEDRALMGYTAFLECLEKRFKEKPLTQRNYIEALRPYLDASMGLSWPSGPWPEPNEGTAPPNPPDRPSPPDPVRPGSDPTSRTPSTQTPETPED